MSNKPLSVRYAVFFKTLKRNEPLWAGVVVVVVLIAVWAFQQYKTTALDYAIESQAQTSSLKGYSMRTVDVILKVNQGDLRQIIDDYLKKTPLPGDVYYLTLTRAKDGAQLHIIALSRKMITRNLFQDYGYLDRSAQPYFQGKWGQYKLLGDVPFDG